ncbi:hypothetical protein TYRP_006055 [Tyrophagus putrescentiae]|nr:hypothetical protein TYRP_006055 [Tyrophagus putrescentiae]
MSEDDHGGEKAEKEKEEEVPIFDDDHRPDVAVAVLPVQVVLQLGADAIVPPKAGHVARADGVNRRPVLHPTEVLLAQLRPLHDPIRGGDEVVDAVEGDRQPDAVQRLAHRISRGGLHNDRKSVVVLAEEAVQLLL